MICTLPTETVKNGCTIPGKCGGEIHTTGSGPDEVDTCWRCGAKFSRDSKEGITHG